MDILCSVRVLVYNNIPYIKDCVESILEQNINSPIEIVFGDDESDDGTSEYLKSINSDNKNHIIKYFCWKRNDPQRNTMGKVPWRFNGIKTLNECNGKYVAYLDGDDYWTDPYKLQKQVDFLDANPEYVLIGSRGDTLNQHTGIVYEDKHPYLDCEISRDRLFHGHHFFSSSVMFENFNFKFPDYFFKYYCGDWMLYFLISEYGKLYLSSDKNMIYRNHSNGVTKRINRVHKETEEIRMLQEINRYFHSKYLYHMDRACNYKAKRLYKNHFDDLTEEQLNIVKSCL